MNDTTPEWMREISQFLVPDTARRIREAADTIDTLRAQLAEAQRELIAKEAERAGMELERNNAQRQHTMQCAINKTDSQRILELTAQLAEAQDALQAAQRLFEEALPKFNWGASFLDANAIQVLNEVPAKVNAAIRAAKVEKNGA